ncbi:MAG: hypothetical protein ACOCSE_01050, partial [Chitinivibrionales bacterium]
NRGNSIALFLGLILFLCSVSGYIDAEAGPPTSLPGEEIGEKDLVDVTEEKEDTVSGSDSTNDSGFMDTVGNSWKAPSLMEQIAEKRQDILMGMGAVFIPTMREPELEPEIEIIDKKGNVVETGKTGRQYNLIPGKEYHLIIGSGSHDIRIVRKIEVEEGEFKPIVPNWSGLTIEVINEDNLPFRGEYEIARVDEFQPVGRGYGEDPEMGEKVKTWILSPGIYKIFNAGDKYNTMTNFVTVRLLPGEYTRFTLVMDESEERITGGGVVSMEPGKILKSSNWTYYLDIGGSMNLDIFNDRADSTRNANSKSLSAVLRFITEYKNPPFNLENRLRLAEGISFPDWDLEQIENATDEFRVRSLFTLNVLERLGPYTRAEFNTKIFPQYISDQRFILLNQDSSFSKAFGVDAQFVEAFGVDASATAGDIDTTFKIDKSFSPINLNTGLGLNTEVANNRILRANVLAGIGLAYQSSWSRFDIESESILDSATQGSYGPLCDSMVTDPTENTSIIRRKEHLPHSWIELGPELILNTFLDIGRVGSIEAECKYFPPFARFLDPDLSLRTNLSFRLIRSLTFDYEFEYNLKQPEAKDSKDEESFRHRLLLRFSFTSR